MFAFQQVPLKFQRERTTRFRAVEGSERAHIDAKIRRW